MDVKIGDRVSVDGKKVGQARREGRVKAVNKGLSGLRLLVQWEDGSESFFSPSGGNLVIGGSRSRARSAGAKPAGKSSSNGARGAKKSAAATRTKATAKKAAAKKPAAKKPAAKKPAAKKPVAAKKPAAKKPAAKKTAKKR